MLFSKSEWKRSAAALSVALVFAGCATDGDDGAPGAEPMVSASDPDDGDDGAETLTDEDGNELLPKAGEQQIDDAIVSVDNHAVEAQTAAPGDEISHVSSGQIPIELNDAVQKWIDYFTVKDHERFQRFLERGEKYRPMVTAVLRDQGVPTEIYYQAMIESGFATHATSHASAVGIWQFIKGTGRRYGLRVDNYVDERRDPMRATIAAALYLKDLYNVFQSWYLAMAAYNAGEGRIMNAIMRAKTRDFWEMVKLGALPAETMDYIPKFLAATIVGHEPRKFGMEDLDAEVSPALVSVAVPSPVRLADVASTSGVSLDVLKEYNPHLLRGVTPPGASTYRLWVPKDQAQDVEEQNDRLASMRLKGLKATERLADSGDRPRYHKVKRGETLAKIGAKYGLTVAQLKKMNNLRGGHVNAGTRLALATPEASSSQQRIVAAASAAEPEAAAPAMTRYKVKRGDNLDLIARRYGMSVDELKKLNRLKRNKVFVGQVLKVTGERKG